MTAIILNVDEVTGKISLALRPSLFPTTTSSSVDDQRTAVQLVEESTNSALSELLEDQRDSKDYTHYNKDNLVPPTATEVSSRPFEL